MEVLSFGLLDLLSLPTKQKSSKLAVDLNDINFASEIYGAISDVRMSWFEAVASEQQLTFMIMPLLLFLQMLNLLNE